MIKVMIGNNVKRESALLDESTTLRSALEQYGIDYTRGLMHLDGAPLGPGDLDGDLFLGGGGSGYQGLGELAPLPASYAADLYLNGELAAELTLLPVEGGPQ